MNVAIYLRKSRKDEEAEKKGEGETLGKHKAALLKYAKTHGLSVLDIFPEVKSGESLMHRPEMLELLRKVELKTYDAVLVMDVDRLGRGNMQEQGLILATFQESNTKIITPLKTYDLRNESDEFMTEVYSVFARRELRMITGRMQRGREQSVEEGNYIGTRPPYGYDIHKKGKERYLVPHPEQAKIVKIIFEWYVFGIPNHEVLEDAGASKIAAELNKMMIPSYEGNEWSNFSVLNMIKNEVYTGRIQWKKKVSKKSKDVDKVREVKARPKQDWIDVEGKHEALISDELFQKAQEILKSKSHVSYLQENGITNPLAGLIRCDMCGASMILRPYTNQPPHIMCYNRTKCVNKSARFEYVETALLQALNHHLDSLKSQWGKRKPKETSKTSEVKESALKTMEKNLKELEAQKSEAHDLLERKVYSEQTYLERSRLLAERTETLLAHIAQTKLDLANEEKSIKTRQTLIPKIESTIKGYSKAKSAADKNKLLKSILQFATYRKEKFQRNNEFTLTLSPKLPR